MKNKEAYFAQRMAQERARMSVEYVKLTEESEISTVQGILESPAMEKDPSLSTPGDSIADSKAANDLKQVKPLNHDGPDYAKSQKRLKVNDSHSSHVECARYKSEVRALKAKREMDKTFWERRMKDTVTRVKVEMEEAVAVAERSKAASITHLKAQTEQEKTALENRILFECKQEIKRREEANRKLADDLQIVSKKLADSHLNEQIAAATAENEPVIRQKLLAERAKLEVRAGEIEATIREERERLNKSHQEELERLHEQHKHSELSVKRLHSAEIEKVEAEREARWVLEKREILRVHQEEVENIRKLMEKSLAERDLLLNSAHAAANMRLDKEIKVTYFTELQPCSVHPYMKYNPIGSGFG
ncbi:hypothetical protein AAMO2058_000917800 [Amorphochlora amoebiformis]